MWDQTGVNVVKREDPTCEQGVSSPAQHKPLTVGMGKEPELGQTEIKEMQVREDGEESQGKINMREHGQRSCQCKYKGDTITVITCYHII